MRNMKFEDFFNDFVWNNGDWDIYADEAYHMDYFSTEKAFQWILRLALENNIEISDKDQTDYDSILYEAYESTEKGLS